VLRHLSWSFVRAPQCAAPRPCSDLTCARRKCAAPRFLELRAPQCAAPRPCSDLTCARRKCAAPRFLELRAPQCAAPRICSYVHSRVIVELAVVRTRASSMGEWDCCEHEHCVSRCAEKQRAAHDRGALDARLESYS
jgi:hypothetical protein